MSNSVLTLLIAGLLYHIGLALFHLCFPWIFAWSKNLRKTDALNRSILPVLNWSLTYCFLAVAVWFGLVLSGQISLQGNGLFLLALSGFWFFRLVQQPVYFGMQKLSVLFCGLFLLGGVIPGLLFLQTEKLLFQ